MKNTSKDKPAPSSQTAWSQYWSKGHLHSCPGAFQGNYDDSIREFWHSAFAELNSECQVLDIGTGNGAIARLAFDYAVSHDLSWQIDGVDAAEIQATAEPIRQGKCSLLLRGLQASEHLDHDDAVIDLVTSQYALEYSTVDQSLAQIARVLTPGGIAAFIMHHSDASTVSVSRHELAFFEFFYQQLSLFDDCRQLIKHFEAAGQISNPSLIARDPVAQQMMQSIQRQLSSITDFTHTHPDCEFGRDINTQFANTLNAVPRTGRQHAEHVLKVLEQEMAAHATRIQANIDAAHSEQAIAALVKTASQLKLDNTLLSPLHRSSGELLGWALRFRRAA